MKLSTENNMFKHTQNVKRYTLYSQIVYFISRLSTSERKNVIYILIHNIIKLHFTIKMNISRKKRVDSSYLYYTFYSLYSVKALYII